MGSVRAGPKIITRTLYGGGGGASADKIKSGATTCNFSGDEVGKVDGSACPERYGREQ